jgi:hypothetical protein
LSMVAETARGHSEEVHVPHLGWLMHAAGEEVARSLDEGWFEYREQAFCWLYLYEGATVIDCGAHVGLFSTLAGKLVGSNGHVVDLRPLVDALCVGVACTPERLHSERRPTGC